MQAAARLQQTYNEQLQQIPWTTLGIALIIEITGALSIYLGVSYPQHDCLIQPSATKMTLLFPLWLLITGIEFVILTPLCTFYFVKTQGLGSLLCCILTIWFFGVTNLAWLPIGIFLFIQTASHCIQHMIFYIGIWVFCLEFLPILFLMIHLLSFTSLRDRCCKKQQQEQQHASIQIC